MVQVSSVPSGARIIVDGKPTGFRTPTAFSLPHGEHRVTLSLAGHRNAEERIRLEPGRPHLVSAVLKPLATGSLSLASLPAGAAISIDGEPTGQSTPAVLRHLAIGTHTVELRRPGSEDWCQAVVVTQNRTLEIHAQLVPSRQGLGRLTVQSQPPRAAISIDGVPTGKPTPERLAEIPAGSHRVDLELEGYQSWSGTVTVREGQAENLLVTLRHLPAQEVGAAQIETDPPGAAITLNGVVLRQKTPANLTRLAPGTYSLLLARPGARLWTGELAVRPGVRSRVEVRLEPEARYGGSIRVESVPPGAAVSVDGHPVGAVTPSLLPNLRPSGHRVTVTLPGYRTWTRVVQVGEGTIETVQARLVPQPFSITAAIAAERGAEVEVMLQALKSDGAPADGVLELDAIAATGSWREPRMTLVGGKANAVLVPSANAQEVSVSVGLGSQREVFVLSRSSGSWEVLSP